MDGSWDRSVVDLFRDGGAFTGAAPKADSRDITAQRVLVDLMTLSGLALGIAGRTAPISGTEHTVSHLLDMAAARVGRPTGLHGAQVGVAALAAAVAWRRLLDGFEPERLMTTPIAPESVMHRRIDDAFGTLDPTGAMADECWSQYHLKHRRWVAMRPGLVTLTETWPVVEGELRDLLGDPIEIARALRSAGAPATFEELDPPASPELATWALFNGHLIRERFTLADLALFSGSWSEEAAASAIDEAASIAGRASTVRSGTSA
jgi:glycerol-1-phosphate dehydrogenase [NAD(P)+]